MICLEFHEFSEFSFGNPIPESLETWNLHSGRQPSNPISTSNLKPQPETWNLQPSRCKNEFHKNEQVLRANTIDLPSNWYPKWYPSLQPKPKWINLRGYYRKPQGSGLKPQGSGLKPQGSSLNPTSCNPHPSPPRWAAWAGGVEIRRTCAGVSNRESEKDLMLRILCRNSAKL